MPGPRVSASPHVTKNPDEIFSDPEISVVLICSSTDTHADLIIKAAKAKKNIFCEKPVDLTVKKVVAALKVVKESGVKLQVGFNRRFDHNFARVRDLVKAGEIGDPQIVKITSRDPAPPPISYVAVSGGLFLDMMIHDFDMARFQAGSEVVEVYAKGAVLVDPAIGKAGDVDTAIVTLTFANGGSLHDRQLAQGGLRLRPARRSLRLEGRGSGRKRPAEQGQALYGNLRVRRPAPCTSSSSATRTPISMKSRLFSTRSPTEKKSRFRARTASGISSSASRPRNPSSRADQSRFRRFH